MPRPLIYLLIILGALTLVPVAYLGLARHTDSTRPRMQVVYDMDSQPLRKAQSRSGFFADGRTARLPVEGTVARGELLADAAFADGMVDSIWVTAFPLAVDEDLLQRGRKRYDIFCAACHGLAGNGDSPVHRRALELAEGTWTPPADLTLDVTRDRPVGEIYSIIKDGVRNMPAYGPQIPVTDRWAIAAYVRALQTAAGGGR